MRLLRIVKSSAVRNVVFRQALFSLTRATLSKLEQLLSRKILPGHTSLRLLFERSL
jgi:hypothetical protein